MKPIQQLISASFAVAALVTASVPALAWSPWSDVDFEWYADVGKPLAQPANAEVAPSPRAGYIWAPGRWETHGARQQWVAGHWVRDEYDQQLAHDAAGNATPTDPAAYPIDSDRR